MVALQVGGMRRVRSIVDGANQYKHAQRSDWATDVDGAAAELAVAKYLNVYWRPGVNTYKAPDVGVLQVRSTMHPTGHLIVRPNDADTDTFIFVVCAPPRYLLVGAYLGAEAKVDEFFHTSHDEADCWWVPQARLRDLPRPRPFGD